MNTKNILNKIHELSKFTDITLNKLVVTNVRKSNESLGKE